MADLFHYTCADHGLPGITASGVVIPNWHPILQCTVAWFTDQDTPDRQRLGLGMNLTRCDRMAFRFTVEADLCRFWLDSPERRSVRSWDLRSLEGFGNPEHWWIASVPVPALRDLSWTGVDR